MKKLLTGSLVIVVIGMAFMISTALAIRNNYIIEKHHSTQAQADVVKEKVQRILTQTMHGLDLGVRGYALTLDDKLLIPYNEAISQTASNLFSIDSLLAVQNYPSRAKLQEVKREIDAYVHFSKEMIEMAKTNQMDQFAAMLREDRGYGVWAKYSEFSTPLFQYEDRLRDESLRDYQDAIRSNLIIQIVILVLVMPILYLFVSKLNDERKRRERLQKEVDTTDRTYVFNPGDSIDENQDANQRSIAHVKRASEFIAAIAAGNYEVEWNGMVNGTVALNKNTLAGNLINLRERLKFVKQEDDRRNWSNEGLAQFSEIVRSNNHQHNELAVKCISFLTKYINAQQGSLFVLEEDGDGKYLNLAGCYAFNRKKWLEKRVEIGNGLIGQTYLEGEPVIIKEIPAGYTTITSGLGDATPNCIVIIPMKYEREVVAVAEFATFEEAEKHHISFLQKAGEYLASAIISTRNTSKMKTLLQDATVREEEMKQREEELRQNMEELQATQEELLRKSKEPEYFYHKSA
jgi:CHASE3 domain sensor protein